MPPVRPCPRTSLSLLVAALLALVALGSLTAATASAAPLAGSSYDSGDGDQADGLGSDWQAAVTNGVVTVAPDRSNDDCYTGGNKELAPGQWSFDTSGGGCVPGKSNVRLAFAQAEPAATTTFAHFGMQRNSTTGDSFLTFELNQGANSWTNSAGATIPCRQNGDLLLSFDVGGSSLATTVYRWTGDGSGPAACPNGASGTFQASGTLGAGVFQGAMNPSAAISNYVLPGTWGTSFPANSFGENAIDLPAVLSSMRMSPCFGFVQMQVHTRSSTSISSAMIDTVGPVPVYMQSCSATGTVYKDVNGNGARDGGDTGQAGFTAYVDLNDNGAKDAGEPAAVTDANGDYRILNVPAGSYRVRIVGQAGWNCTQPSPCSYSRSWVSGGNQTGLDFGLTGPSTVSGTVYEDANANGARDTGELSLAGQTFYVDYNDDGALSAGEPSGTSDAFGAWSIGNVVAGSYKVREVAAAGWTCSQPTPCSSAQTFASGSNATGLAFGDWRAATVSGTVFEDANGDGSAKGAGDTGQQGWQVFLDTNGNGSFDLGEPQTTTDVSGAYSFSGLAPGDYSVRETLASASWYCARPSLTPSACKYPLTATSGGAVTGRDFGNSRYATVSGQAYDDADASATKGSSESGLAGVTVYVDYNGDSAVTAGEPSAVTDASGNFTMTSVRAGSWPLKSVPFGAYKCTQPATTCSYPLTLASGGSATGNAFGENQVRSVSGTVFKDANANAAKDTGETGLAGWQVYADTNNNSAYDSGEPTATSNGVGAYTLTGMPNGSYKIRVVGQTGWTCDYPAGCLQTGSIGNNGIDSGMDFGVYTSGTVSGMVFEDTNGDGSAKTGGDAGLAGRTVFVDYNNNGTADSGEPSATSAADGTYTLTGVTNGTWTLRRLPGSSGFTSSYPTGGTWSVTLASNSLAGRDFGSYKPATIAGQLYEDANANGAKDSGETGIAGRTVFLDANNNGAADSGESTATTDASGNYAFSAVAPGSVRVRQVLPSGWTQSAPAAPHDLTLVSQSAVTGRDFGAYTTGQIAGRVFDDSTFDGGPFSAAAGDTGVAGRTVYLDANGNGVKDSGEATATTDGTGAYAFTGLAPGDYVVRSVTPAGVACSYPSPCSWAATVTSRGAATAKDFGTYTGGAISGTVFEDADGDGSARQSGDAAAAGQTVYLDANDNGSLDSGEASTTTDADGAYAFTGLTVTTQRVRVSLASGWSCDSPSPCVQAVAVTSGSSTTGQDFGVHRAASISGHLWTDSNAAATGVQAFGDNDQPGRTVYLDANDNGTRDDGETSTTTDDSGNYAFSGLRPGAYVVREDLPGGWVCSSPSPCRRGVSLVSGQAATGADFSSYTTASITGTYFEDLDASGLVPDTNGTDPALAGRTVYLDLDNNGRHDPGEPTQTTGADGAVDFGSLAPGTYHLRSAAQPAGWTCSAPAGCAQTVTVEAGEYAQDDDFGAWTTATASGAVYDDTDGNGAQGSGEAGRSGVVVYADLDDNGARDSGEPTATTGSDGRWSIPGLAPGAAHLRIVEPRGSTCTAPDPCRHDLTLTSHETAGGNDFGLTAGASVAGTVYRDGDADGAQGSGETGLGGRIVTAHPLTGDDVTATTADDGGYLLEGLASGVSYAITVAHVGESCSQPSGCSYTLTPASGDAVTGDDFGLYATASVSGAVYRDGNADGVKGSGESGLAGRTVTAHPLTGDDVTATTDDQGAYVLDDLMPGVSYTVTVGHTGEQCSEPSGCSYTLTPSSGDAVTGDDFGLYATASVAGTVYRDGDADGSQGGGESGLSGRTVTAHPATGDDVTATTDDQGAYVLDGLTPGTTYTVTVGHTGEQCSQPSGCSYTVTPSSGDAVTGDDFGLYATASVAGAVYRDTNADGSQVSGEGGLAGRTVTAHPATGDDVTATTDDQGAYVLEGLMPGVSYTVTVGHPGEQCSEPSGCSYTLTPASGDAVIGDDFGLYATASVAGTVYRDTNAGGSQGSGENGLAGRTVTAHPLTGDDVTATTDDQGAYVLDGLMPGVSYTVTVGHTGEQCSEPSGCSYTLTPASGDAVTGDDFGLYATASVAGAVYRDANADGSQGSGENGLAGRTVTAHPATGDDVTATTGDQGAYVLDGLTPGTTYTVTVGHTGEQCSEPSGCSYTVTPSSGDAVTGDDFGLYATASVAGTVYRDTNADGSQGSGENGLAGRTVTAHPATGDDVTATTDDHGAYVLDGLTPGTTYTVTVGHAGEQCSEPSGCSYTVTPSSGDAVTGDDFGLYENVTLAGTVYRDNDADGTQNTGDVPLAGQTVTIDPGTPSDTTDDLALVTGAEGRYSASGLRPAVAYAIDTVPGAHHACSEPASCHYSVTPASGAGTITRDFGITADLASISGTVWHDLDADGTRDTGDTGLDGRSVFLDLDDNGRLDAGEPATTTDATGAYHFDGLRPGDYVVRKELPSADWHCSAPASCRIAVTLSPGDALTGRDFGIWRTASVSGTQFTDLDGNGARDAGEPAESGWTVYADLDGNGSRDAGEPSATTAADGSYTIDGLLPGPVHIREVAQDQRACSAPDGCAHAVTLVSGDSRTGLDFGAKPAPKAAPAPRPEPTVGPPTLTQPDPDGPPITQVPGPDGGTTYQVPRGDGCTPLQVSIPITDTTGAVTDVVAIFTPADGSAPQTIALADTPPEPADGVWTGTLPCAADGKLEVRYKVDGAPQTHPVGQIELIDPQGTVYDAQAYQAAIGNGLSPSEARCASALGGASVTLQRQSGSGFADVPSDDAGIAPGRNPQLTSASGAYGWDVSDGTYRVSVAKDGYAQSYSRAVAIPPPVTDLHVGLRRLPGTKAPVDRTATCVPQGVHVDHRSSCTTRPLHAWLRGSAISAVRFYLDGRLVGSVHRPDGHGRFGVMVSRSRLKPGTHFIAAVARMRGGGLRKFHLSIARCLRLKPPTAIHGVPAAAPAKPFTAWVAGDEIRSVTYVLDGHTVKVMRVADWRHRYGVAIDPSTLRRGTHRLVARITFARGTGLKPHRLRASFTGGRR